MSIINDGAVLAVLKCVYTLNIKWWMMVEGGSMEETHDYLTFLLQINKSRFYLNYLF